MTTEEKIYEFYEYIADKIVDMKNYVEHMKNPEDREVIELDVQKVKDACADITRAYGEIDEALMSDEDEE